MNAFFRKIFNKNLLQYLGISYFSTILNLILNVLLIKYLTPTLLGKVTIGKSIFQSFEYSHCGIRFGLDRLIPHCESEEEKNPLFSVAFLFSFISSLIFVCFWVFYDISNYLFYSTFYISGILFSLSMIYRVYYRTYENKSRFVTLSFWVILIPLVMKILGLIIFGLYGFLIFHLLGYILSYFVCYKFYGVVLVLRKREIIPVFKRLFSTGYLLFLSAIINFLSSTGDRFFIAKYWGLEMTGGFSVIMFFFSALTLLFTNYTELIMNKITLTPSYIYIIKQILFIGSIAIVLFLVIYPVIPYFVINFIPEYQSHIRSMRMILLSTIPYATLPILNHYMHAIDKRNVLLSINAVCSFIYFIGLFFVLLHYREMEILILLKTIFIFTIVSVTFAFFLHYEIKRRKKR
jgi:O-antigen/teichoic acid export membrane protein